MSRAQRAIKTLRTLLHYKSFVFGILVILFFIGLTMYIAILIPYSEAEAKWNDPAAWIEYPRYAKPAWFSLLTGKRELEGSLKITGVIQGRAIIEEQVNYDYDEFGSYMMFMININTPSRVLVKVTWIKPNNVTIVLEKGLFTAGSIYRRFEAAVAVTPEYVVEYAEKIKNIYNVELDVEKLNPFKILFADDEYLVTTSQYRVLKGTYIIRIETIGTSKDSVEYQILIQGTAYGLAGTDHRGRDLFIGIAWGTPIAMSFGLLVSIILTLAHLIIAAMSAWYRGTVDTIIDRLNEIYMILPGFMTILMIFILYGLTLWQLVLVIVILNLFGGGVKVTRAMFLQVREMPYIEAALAYGASNWRIVFRYMVPRVLPVIIPNIITSVPSFVFLEAALAIFGATDPKAITWGKILEEAYRYNALLAGFYHWILAPSIMLFLMGIAFASIGFTLDRVFNPRLKQI